MFWGWMKHPANPVCNKPRRIILYQECQMHCGCKHTHQVLLSFWQASLGEEQHLMGPAALRNGECNASKHSESPVSLLRASTP